MIPKISGECYAVRSMVHISNIKLSNEFAKYTFILL